jgi:Cu(I)/Ag(I) efflux system membrane fusion protein
MSRWKKVRLVIKVVELRLRFIALLAATGLVFAYWDTLWNRYDKWMRPESSHRHVAASGIEYYCPMHPQVIRDEPGSCPICGMPLSKRKKGEKASLPEGVLSRLVLTPERVAHAGVRTAEVGFQPLTETLTTVGTVEADEGRVARVDANPKGVSRVEKVLIKYTGTAVKAGQPLAELVSAELYQPLSDVLLSNAYLRVNEAKAQDQPQARVLVATDREAQRFALARLTEWGLTEAQIEAVIDRLGPKVKLPDNGAGPGAGPDSPGRVALLARIPVFAPIDGVVVRKAVVEGQSIEEGQPLFELADLSHVWLRARVYEDQVGRVRVGQAVEATVQAYPGEVFRGTVAIIDPTLDSESRTAGVRYDLENTDGRLRPGMSATVTLKTPVADTPMFRDKLAAPEPSGHPAHLASMTVAEQKVCPVTNAKLGSMGEPVPVEVEGKRVWTCCDGCPPKLKADPKKYLAKLLPPPRDGVLTVPESAVIDTGAVKLVYVETQPGIYEGRRVVLGPRSGDRFPVLEGLSPGEKVVAAGAFLVDAESRLNPATRGGAQGGEPAPGGPPASGPVAGKPAAVASGHVH